MTEKSFREIEAEIGEKGFKALLNEAAYEIQNITRTLSYLMDKAADKETADNINSLSGQLVRSGITLLKIAETIPDEE